MTINSSHSASVQLKDPVRDEQNVFFDARNNPTAATETSQPVESTDLLTQGMPYADAEPHTPTGASHSNDLAKEAAPNVDAQNASFPVPPAASEFAEPSCSSVPQESPPANARPSTPIKLHDTPAKARSFHATSYRNADLEDRRIIAVKDLQTVDLVSVDYFFSYLLPEIHEDKSISVETVMADLEGKGYLVKKGGKLTWTNNTTSKKSGRAASSSSRFTLKKKALAKRGLGTTGITKLHEDEHYKPFEGLFNEVVDSARRVSGNKALATTHSYRMEPRSHPKSDRNEKMRPDACFVKGPTKKNRKDRTSWFDVACVGEFKKAKNEKDEKDNVRKVLYGMNYILASDTCRRFVTGFTIDKDTMSLWHGSRSTLLKCKFDYKKEPERLVHLFLAFAFADKKGLETGWDPTVTPKETSNGRQYIFDVEGKKYHTVRVIDEHGTDSMLGRGTRVYLVTEEGTNVFMVLKDYWVDETRFFEKVIMEEIVKDVTEHCGTEAAEFLKKHTLTVLQETWVKVGDRNDGVLDVIMGGRMPDYVGIESLVQKTRNSSYKSRGCRDSHDHVTSAAAIEPQDAHKHRPVRRLCHRRVVYKQYATPIDKVDVLSKAVKTLDDTTKVLQFMHQADWVHRDISTGNVYWYEDGEGERGLLADFEYAKRRNRTGEHEVITGTIYYMAAEAIERCYKYTPDDASVWKSEDEVRVFFHNPVHDMESIFWVIFYIAVNVDSKEGSVRSKIDGLLFTGLESSANDRFSFLINSSKAGWEYYGKLFGIERKDLLVSLSTLRTILTKCYKEAEANYPKEPIDDSKISGIHEKFSVVWKACREYFVVNGDVRLESGSKTEQVRTSVKREAEPDPRPPRTSKRIRTHEPTLEEIIEDDNGRV